MDPAKLLASAVGRDGEAGQTFGPYLLIDEIGRGGMGVVFTALDERANRVVALKIPHAAGKEITRRFRAEAEAIAALDHPGILPIYEAGEVAGVPYFAMKLAEVGSLAERLEAFARQPRKAAALVAAAADAVQHAHERGILHRDLKPQNILLQQGKAPEEWQPMIADFGLARWLGRDSDLTHSQAVLGTPGYLAPETLRGSRAGVTTAADIFSLGAIFYHLLTGRVPFAGNSLAETLQRITEAAPRAPRSCDAAIPRDLESICLRCLEREPERRYRSARELADDLRRWLRGEPVRARALSLPEKTWRWCRRRPALASALVGLFSVVVVAFGLVEAARRREGAAKARAESASVQLRDALATSELDRSEALFNAGESGEALALLASVARREPAHPVATARLASALWHGEIALPLRPLQPGGEVVRLHVLRDARTLLAASSRGVSTWDFSGQRLKEFQQVEGSFQEAALSPDERKLVVWERKAGARFAIFDVASGRCIVAPTPHEPWWWTVSFSPDGARFVVATSDRALRVFDARTGQVSGDPMLHEVGQWAAAYSPDGTLIAANGRGVVSLWDAATQQLRQRLPALPAEVRVLRFSPDGRWLFAGSVDGAMRIFSMEDGEPVSGPMRHDDALRSAAFSTDSRRLVTAANDHTARIWSVPAGEPLTPPLRHRDSVSAAIFNHDASRVATCGRDHVTRVWDARTGRPLTQPLRHPEQPLTATFAPDGATLFASGSDGMVLRWDLRGINEAPGSEPLPGVKAGRADVCFSPDGGRVATITDDHTVRVRDAASGRAVTPPLAHPLPVAVVCFSPDGRTLLTATRSPTQAPPSGDAARLWDAFTGQPRGSPMPHLDDIHAAVFSPDGSLVATASDDNTARVWDARTGTPVSPALRHGRSAAAVAFSPDGRQVATASWDGTARVWDARRGEMRGRILQHGDWVNDVCFSPDGRRIATASRDKTVRLWDSATGMPLSHPLQHDDAVTHVNFLPGGDQVVAHTAAGARRWQAPAFPAPAPVWLPALVEMITLSGFSTEREIAAAEFTARYETLRAHALANPPADPYARLAARFFRGREK